MYSAYDYSEVISCTWLSFSLPGLIRVASSSCIGITTISSSSIQPLEIFHCHIEPSINPMHTVNLIPSGSHTADWVTGPLSNLDDVMCFIFDSLRSVFAFNICICWIINPVLPLKMKTSPSAINVRAGSDYYIYDANTFGETEYVLIFWGTKYTIPRKAWTVTR